METRAQEKVRVFEQEVKVRQWKWEIDEEYQYCTYDYKSDHPDNGYSIYEHFETLL